MSKRLQVLLEPKEYKNIQHLAEEEGLSLGEWVRQVLRTAAAGFSSQSPAEKLKKVRLSSQQTYPTGDIEKILEEIEKGYLES
ncbi:MAG: antitoxin [Deltaproteobacteria bacterium]|nr:antitoxin [Deltaproteobacteria bacterium]